MAIYEDILAALPEPGRGLVRPGPSRLIRVSGPDALEFLHRLCSQDVLGLTDGEAAFAAFLDPKGKLITTATVGRLGPESGLVDVPAEAHDRLAELLDRYHFTEQLELAPATDASVSVAVVGRDVPAAAGLVSGRCAATTDGLVTIAAARRGVSWARAHGPADAVEAWCASLGELVELPSTLADALRIAAGLPRIGVDTDERTLGLEADVDDHVSTTKGCYTGQEIVARIHTYGHVNRKLALVSLATDDGVEPGTMLCETEDGDPVGRVLSTVPAPAPRTGRIGLAYLPESFLAAGTPLTVASADGAAAQVEAFGPA